MLLVEGMNQTHFVMLDYCLIRSSGVQWGFIGDGIFANYNNSFLKLMFAFAGF